VGETRSLRAVGGLINPRSRSDFDSDQARGKPKIDEDPSETARIFSKGLTSLHSSCAREGGIGSSRVWLEPSGCSGFRYGWVSGQG
jgi:hypothetical protein